MEAAATGSSVNSLKSDSRGTPNSDSTMARAALASKGGSRSCRAESSAAISSPTRSGRVESAWPNLMKLGPSFWNAPASRRPGVPNPRFLGAMPARRVTDGTSPWSRRRKSASQRAKVQAIRSSRPIFLSARRMARVPG